MVPIRKSTKGFALYHALAFALSRVRLARFKLGLSEDQRFEIAEATVHRLQEDGRWPELNDVSEPRPPAPSRLPGPYETSRTVKIKLARGIV
jgi:hypothetical protein